MLGEHDFDVSADELAAAHIRKLEQAGIIAADKRLVALPEMVLLEMLERLNAPKLQKV